MRISELSRRSGVSVATIKYYLREGLLPAGRATAATQAEYDEDHVRRLRLVRALVSVRGLTVQATGEVMRALDGIGGDRHTALGLVLGVVPLGDAKPQEPPTPRERELADRVVEAMGWQVYEESTLVSDLGRTLGALDRLDLGLDWHQLLPYAELAERTARLDLDALGDEPEPLRMAERALLLTVLLEPVLLTLRRLAQENESARRHTAGARPEPVDAEGEQARE